MNMLRENEEERRWLERRSWALELLMLEKGVISAIEIKEEEWDEMRERAEREAGPRPDAWSHGTAILGPRS